MNELELERIEKRIDKMADGIINNVGLTVRAANAEMELRLSGVITRVEESAKAAHHRIDEQTGRFDRLSAQLSGTDKRVAEIGAVCNRNHRDRRDSNAPAARKGIPPVVFKVGLPAAGGAGGLIGIVWAILHALG